MRGVFLVAGLVVAIGAGAARGDDGGAAGQADVEVGSGSDLFGSGQGLAVDLGGELRGRGELLDNLDLDRGLTPSGQPLFPVGAEDGEPIGRSDARLRAELDARLVGAGLAVHAGVDATGGGATVAGAEADRADRIALAHAYGEALTPMGVLVAGRVPSHWGLGILTHGGHCETCDPGDAADRAALGTAVFDHQIAVSADLPTSRMALAAGEPAWAASLSLARRRMEIARERRRRAGKVTLEYGGLLHQRWTGDGATSARSTAASGWMRLTLPRARIETEVVFLVGRVGEGALAPGIRFADPVTSRQLGAAVESSVDVAARLAAGLDGGFASGDPAPGFGTVVEAGEMPPGPGELDGVQANPPWDQRVDNYRFHPQYRVDRILFREIVGTVTDAVYLRPHAELRLYDGGPGSELVLSLAAVASWAVEASSTPGGARRLGAEIDPTLIYRVGGLAARLEHALFLPGPGLDQPGGLPARAAQLIRLQISHHL